MDSAKRGDVGFQAVDDGEKVPVIGDDRLRSLSEVG